MVSNGLTMSLQSTLSPTDLARYVRGQLDAFFPDGVAVATEPLRRAVEGALARIEHCFMRVRVERYRRAGQARFDHLYSDQYLVFLWFLANELWRHQAEPNTINKVYLLNKCLHGFDCAWDTGLPEVFVVIHGVGTVLGKAQYADFLVVYQGCTVGQTQNRYPQLGRGVGLGAGASVIGGCTLGDFSSVGVGCALTNLEVPADASAYRDRDGKLVFSGRNRGAIAAQYFLEEFLFA
jgi:serine O-acetyltransferase